MTETTIKYNANSETYVLNNTPAFRKTVTFHAKPEVREEHIYENIPPRGGSSTERPSTYNQMTTGRGSLENQKLLALEKKHFTTKSAKSYQQARSACWRGRSSYLFIILGGLLFLLGGGVIILGFYLNWFKIIFTQSDFSSTIMKRETSTTVGVEDFVSIIKIVGHEIPIDFDDGYKIPVTGDAIDIDKSSPRTTSKTVSAKRAAPKIADTTTVKPYSWWRVGTSSAPTSYTSQPTLLKITTPYQNILSVSINLDRQIACPHNKNLECWDSLLIYNDGVANTVTAYRQTAVVVNNLLNPSYNCQTKKKTCPYLKQTQCFLLQCNQRQPVTISTPTDEAKGFVGGREATTAKGGSFSSQQGGEVMPVNIYFELENGNYRSSWQSSGNLPLASISNMRRVQSDMMNKINKCTLVEPDVLFLSFTTVGYEPSWQTSMHTIETFSYNVNKNAYIVNRSKIGMSSIHINDLQTHLHERVHEYINPHNTRRFMHSNIFMDRDVVNAVVQSNTASSGTIMRFNDGSLGLQMQDAGHLGNWGYEAAPSSYQQPHSHMGKYTILVMKAIGYLYDTTPFEGERELPAVNVENVNEREAAAINMIFNHINGNKIVIFSLSWCPHCIYVKQLFSQLQIQYSSIEFDKLKDNVSIDEYRQVWKKISGISTVPQIFVNKKFVGGRQEIEAAYRTGTLNGLLKI
jgi:glutaredoxin